MSNPIKKNTLRKHEFRSNDSTTNVKRTVRNLSFIFTHTQCWIMPHCRPEATQYYSSIHPSPHSCFSFSLFFSHFLIIINQSLSISNFFQDITIFCLWKFMSFSHSLLSTSYAIYIIIYVYIYNASMLLRFFIGSYHTYPYPHWISNLLSMDILLSSCCTSATKSRCNTIV